MGKARMHRRLDAQRIIETVDLLSRRINERFPNSGLYHVCLELLQIAKQADQRSRQIARPMYGVRLASALLVSTILGGFAYFAWRVNAIRIADQPMQPEEFVQVIEAGFNSVILIGATILFLVTLEVRVKRSRALKAVHELRSLVHIVDMHQLTKDPERVLWKGPDTASSPKREMTTFQLNRYLDYCSEMLDLSGKIAALYVDNFADSQAVSAVNDLETLTNGMTRKVWQKIMILHSAKDASPTTDDAAPFATISGPPAPVQPISPPVSPGHPGNPGKTPVRG